MGKFLFTAFDTVLVYLSGFGDVLLRQGDDLINPGKIVLVMNNRGIN